MTKEEVLAISGLTAKQKAQVERCFNAWERLHKVSAFEPMTTASQAKDFINAKLAAFEKAQKAKENRASKKTSRDIQKLALTLCKGRNKALTFDELYDIIKDSVATKRRKELEKKRAALLEQVNEVESQMNDLA